MLNDKQIDEAIKLLKSNKIIIIPTDTIYGLSALVSDINQARINQIKKSSKTKPITILISSLNDLKELKISANEDEIRMLNSNDPTTLIFANKEQRALGVRLIAREDIKKIISEVGPVFSSSVNIHKQKPINSSDELDAFDPEVAVFFDKDLTNHQPSRIYNTITKEWIR